MAATEAVESTPQFNKRKASKAGLSATTGRPVKRRASRACCCCRARKVRCDVVEHGSPCTNCRLDQVECIVSESRRRKKARVDGEHKVTAESSTDLSEDTAAPRRVSNASSLSPSHQTMDGESMSNFIYQSRGSQPGSEAHRMPRSGSMSAGNQAPAAPNYGLRDHLGDGFQQLLKQSRPRGFLPDYIRGLPQRFQPEDIEYLATKGALTVPEPELRNALLKAYIHYVHPFMPLLDLEDFLVTIARNDGVRRLSLLLFQAVMFAGTAFVDMEHLQKAGYHNRKMARKIFFQRARLLYDFDYEVDRIALVQSLLLMTYWYETPDDQKDTWHWMGVSLSLAHTIGLHRDPTSSAMNDRRKRLWKRIWWSAYTRDRLIALGMRRPMRIKDDDCDVSMLTIDDFELKTYPSEVLDMLGDCELLRNSEQQRQLAVMFIEKAKLCLGVSHVLSAQYSVLSHRFGGTTETTMMLVPKKSANGALQVRQCDEELEQWQANLPPEALYEPYPPDGPLPILSQAEESLFTHRALLRMIYLTTSSALHRPQVLPASPFPAVEEDLQELSRSKVRYAAVEITNTAQVLHRLNLTRFLPTAGVTVLLPAVIIHLLDIKSNDPAVRMVSLQRFYQCMRILQRLRDIYASADFATSFLEAAIRKAGIQLNVPATDTSSRNNATNNVPTNGVTATTTAAPAATSSIPPPSAPSMPATMPRTLTPPPDSFAPKMPDMTYPDNTDMNSNTLSFNDGVAIPSVATPPHSNGSENGSMNPHPNPDLDPDPNPNMLFDDDPGMDNMGFAFSMDPNSMSQANLSLDELIDLANDAEVTQNDFDALINFDDGGADFFTNNNNNSNSNSNSNNSSTFFNQDGANNADDKKDNNINTTSNKGNDDAHTTTTTTTAAPATTTGDDSGLNGLNPPETEFLNFDFGGKRETKLDLSTEFPGMYTPAPATTTAAGCSVE